MNKVILVGRITEMNLSENDENKSTITIAVSRPFKNADGIYDTDFINCTIMFNTAKRLNEYTKIGDVIGINGRVQTNNTIIAEKITFLSSSK